MEVKRTQEIYTKIFNELMQSIREDPILNSQLDTEDFEFLEKTWDRKLKESGVFNSYNPALNFPRTGQMLTPGSYFQHLNSGFRMPQRSAFTGIRGTRQHKQKMMMEEAKRYAKNFGFYQKGGLPLMEFGEGSNPFGARAKAFKEDSLAANDMKLFHGDQKSRIKEEDVSEDLNTPFKTITKLEEDIDSSQNQAPKSMPLKLTISMSKKLGGKRNSTKQTKENTQADDDDDGDLFSDSDSGAGKDGGNQPAKIFMEEDDATLQPKDKKVKSLSKNLNIQFSSNMKGDGKKKESSNKNEKTENSDAELGKREQESDDEDLFADSGAEDQPAANKKLKIQDLASGDLPEPKANEKDEMISESTRNLMEERVQAAIVKDEERRLQEEKKQEEEQGLENNGLGDDEEELNSADDVSEYEEDIDPGRNILLAYFKKFSRKKDRRKIVFQHCILRINEEEFIVPNAKGHFDWDCSSRIYP